MKEKKSSHSNSRRAKKIIRSWMFSSFAGKTKEKKLKAMEANVSDPSIRDDYRKGQDLVNSGNFDCYTSDARGDLKKIYGRKVKDWDADKVWNTYRHLISREYASMNEEVRKTGKIRR
jgi:hypothetical protein